MTSPEESIPLTRPDLSEEAIAEVVACLRSGWLTMGPRVERFEAALAQRLGGPEVIACSSGTAGLWLALTALGLEPGDEVLTSSLTFVATFNAISRVGVIPVPVDIRPDTLQLDVAAAARALSPRTKAIMPVHFGGRPVDCDALYAFAEAHGLRVVEDASHAIGAAWKGEPIGAFGDVQVFSFHPNKNLTTADGGCVVTRDRRLAEQVRLLRLHGARRASSGGAQPYDIVVDGLKWVMTDLQASIGLHQLPLLDGCNRRRAELADAYRAALAERGDLWLPPAAGADITHAWHLFSVQAREHDRDAVRSALAERGVATGLHYPLPHLSTWYRRTFGFSPGLCPVAEDVAARIFSLPLFPGLTDEQQARVVRHLIEVLS